MNANSPVLFDDELRALLTNKWRSSFKILLFGPEPLTRERSIPNSLASFLVAGPACLEEPEP